MLPMLSRSIIDNSRSIIDDSRSKIDDWKIMVWLTYDSRGVTYDCNVLIIQDTVLEHLKQFETGFSA